VFTVIYGFDRIYPVKGVEDHVSQPLQLHRVAFLKNLFPDQSCSLSTLQIFLTVSVNIFLLMTRKLTAATRPRYLAARVTDDIFRWMHLE